MAFGVAEREKSSISMLTLTDVELLSAFLLPVLQETVQGKNIMDCSKLSDVSCGSNKTIRIEQQKGHVRGDSSLRAPLLEYISV